MLRRKDMKNDIITTMFYEKSDNKSIFFFAFQYEKKFCRL